MIAGILSRSRADPRAREPKRRLVSRVSRGWPVHRAVRLREGQSVRRVHFRCEWRTVASAVQFRSMYQSVTPLGSCCSTAVVKSTGRHFVTGGASHSTVRHSSIPPRGDEHQLDALVLSRMLMPCVLPHFLCRWVNEYMISNETLLHKDPTTGAPQVIGLGWLDDSMQLSGPTEEDKHVRSVLRIRCNWGHAKSS